MRGESGSARRPQALAGNDRGYMATDSFQTAQARICRRATISCTTMHHQQLHRGLGAPLTTSCIFRRVSKCNCSIGAPLTMTQLKKRTGRIRQCSARKCLRALCRRRFLRVCLRLTVATCGGRVAHTLLQPGLQYHYHLPQELPRHPIRTSSRTRVSQHHHELLPVDMVCSISMRALSSIAYHLSSTAVSACSSVLSAHLEPFPRYPTRFWMHRILPMIFTSISSTGAARTLLELA
jgi:hypothetical protein